MKTGKREMGKRETGKRETGKREAEKRETKQTETNFALWILRKLQRPHTFFLGGIRPCIRSSSSAKAVHGSHCIHIQYIPLWKLGRHHMT